MHLNRDKRHSRFPLPEEKPELPKEDKSPNRTASIVLIALTAVASIGASIGVLRNKNQESSLPAPEPMPPVLVLQIEEEAEKNMPKKAEEPETEGEEKLKPISRAEFRSSLIKRIRSEKEIYESLQPMFTDPEIYKENAARQVQNELLKKIYSLTFNMGVSVEDLAELADLAFKMPGAAKAQGGTKWVKSTEAEINAQLASHDRSNSFGR